MDEGLLIALVEKHPNLYDKTRKDFKDARIRENSWEEIAAAMNQPVEECQRVWMNIRNRFGRERKKKKTTPSGSSQTVEEAWSLFPALGFLEEHVKPRQSTGNLKRKAPRSTSPSPNTSRASSVVGERPGSGLGERPGSGLGERPGSASSGSLPEEPPPWDTMAVLTQPFSDDAEGDPLLQQSQGWDMERGEAEDESLHLVHERDATPAKEPVALNVAGPSKPTKKSNQKLEEQIASTAAQISAFVTARNKQDSDVAFGNYVGLTLQEMPKRHKNKAKLAIMEVLDQFSTED